MRLGSGSDIFITGQVTGFGITLNPGGGIFGGTPGFSETAPVLIDYHPFINDTSIEFWATGQPQLTTTADTDISVLAACSMVSSECGGAVYDQNVPLNDDDLVVINSGNEELIFANRPRPPGTPN